MPIENTGIVSEADKELYDKEGYMILDSVIPQDMLEMLREECSYYLGYFDSQMDTAGETVQGINHRGKRYFISNRYRYSTRMHQFIFSELMAEICLATLGKDACLIHEQWVIKGADKGMKFGWHQDSGYLKSGDKNTKHKPYLSCWCPLDDVNEENGSVYLLPHSRGGTTHKIFDHEREEGSNDLIGYKGDDPGIAIEAPAGSVIAFTSLNFHRSGSNSTDKMRRVYLPQYSCEPITHSETGELTHLRVPFIENGELVYDHANDRAENWGGAEPPFKLE
ncbi:MAG: phytanoyl-CoA dioxygenase family protein [Lentisphaeria bacterium]|nr:phytanoyl-CoA dioxygenase family protein [Lentisphaeria bacterium]NQZ68966.1 phytanoyl-CoA dioxygenase family protein [Lentisphaeria bacterium]